MATQSLTLSSPALLAEYVHQSDLQGLFEKRLAAPPDHVAILIRNGQFVDAYKGAHFSIGGIFQGLKTLVAGSMHLRILLADLKPFAVQIPLTALTRDRVQVAGVCTIELQVNPDAPQNVMGLVNPLGVVTRGEVLARFRPHLTDRVFEAVIGRIDAAELRGNQGLQDKLQGDVMRELQRVAGDIGVLVRAVSAEWAQTSAEREAMAKAELDREQGRLDHELGLLRRSLARTADATQLQLRTDVDLATLKVESDDQLARLALRKEVEFLDAREQAQRRQEMDALAHEIGVLGTERAARFENQLAEAGQQIDLGRYRSTLTRVELEIETLRQTHLAEMKKVGAFTELEIEQRAKNLELDLSARAQRQGLEQVAGLAAIEREANEHETRLREGAKDGHSRRELDAIQAQAAARVAQLQAGAAMTPEQILAINAGLSADVAAILVERARSQASGNEQTMAAMRELVNHATAARVASEDQAREMFRMGMEGAIGVARGAGGKDGSIAAATPTAATTVECAQCGRESAAKAKFCVGCGHKLRS